MVMQQEKLTEELSLRDLFAFGGGGKAATDVKAGLKKEDLGELRKAIPGLVSWGKVQSIVADSVGAALDVPLLDTMADAWTHYRALMDDARESKASPKSHTVSKLAQHSITSTLHPVVEVMMGPKVLKEVVFDVTLTTTVMALQLCLEDGAIVSVGMGMLGWVGSIGVKGHELLKRPLVELVLPGELKLKRPLVLVKNS